MVSQWLKRLLVGQENLVPLPDLAYCFQLLRLRYKKSLRNCWHKMAKIKYIQVQKNSITCTARRKIIEGDYRHKFVPLPVMSSGTIMLYNVVYEVYNMVHSWQTLAVQLQSKLDRINLSRTFFLSRRMKGRDSVSASFFLFLFFVLVALAGLVFSFHLEFSKKLFRSRMLSEKFDPARI